MSGRVYNFGAGPAMLPGPVMEQAQREFLNYRGIGASVIEISHRSADFMEVVEAADALLAELAEIPENYRILYVHGGAQMQFSAIPLNLIQRGPARRAAYVVSGNFASLAAKEAARYGEIDTSRSSAASNFDRIPEFRPDGLAPDASYVHITSNNTIYGTRWNDFPDTGAIPLVADMTSELLSRRFDMNRFGAVFASLQKNLGPSGLAVVIIREDLLGHALPETPALLNYRACAEKHSLANTINTFALYLMKLVLEWLRDEGGVAAIEQRNTAKAALLYDVIDQSDFYLGTAHPPHRSHMNVTFHLADDARLGDFLREAGDNGLYALKGHRNVGGARASIYNAMPTAGCKALADFMKHFERSRA